MNQISITLSGEIQNSNFNEWKNELINQIQSTNSHLVTDEDFVSAASQVKLFKSAENALKQAKQSAINQAADIQELFAAIDEVSAKAREARLVLERQIKARKQEIKEQLISSGIERIHDFIQQQNSNFHLITHKQFTDHRRFENVVKGKAGIKGIEIAIETLSKTIEQEIADKAAIVNHNALTINELPSHHQILFQDLSSLLDLDQQSLRLTIEKRIALLNEENARTKAEKAVSELEKIENVELNPENSNASINKQIPEINHYRLVIDILSTKDDAIEIARSIKHDYSENDCIFGIKLTRKRDK